MEGPTVRASSSQPARPWRRAHASYEEVAADHWYPHIPRSANGSESEALWRSPLGREMPKAEIGWHFLRAALFLAKYGCFTAQEDIAKCCVWTAHGRLATPPKSCEFNEIYLQDLCCAKEVYKEDLFAEPPYMPNRSLRAPTLRAALSSQGCTLLRRLEGARIVEWAGGLAALPHAHWANCVAGSLAARLGRAPVEESLQALAVIGGAVRSKCPGRRAIVALRRNVMVWRRRAEGLLQVAGVADRAYGLMLVELERCRLALDSEAPVVHVHVPKTAGTSLCWWAKQRGLQTATFRGSPCYLRGDGPHWLGEGMLAASCRQRRAEAKSHNISWFSVERWVDLPLCDDMKYVVALRRPLDRLTHHFSHLLGHFSSFFDGAQHAPANFFGKIWNYGRLRPKLEELGRRPAEDPGDWLDDWLGMASNYQVRIMAGAGGGKAFTERGDVAMERLGAAAAVLEQIDVVLVVGDQPGQFIGLHQEHLLSRLLSMPQSAGAASFPAKRHNSAAQSQSEAWSWAPGELRETHARNLADARLVAYARLLEELDSEYLSRFGLGWTRTPPKEAKRAA